MATRNRFPCGTGPRAEESSGYVRYASAISPRHRPALVGTPKLLAGHLRSTSLTKERAYNIILWEVGLEHLGD